jgi:hypothetical protein
MSFLRGMNNLDFANVPKNMECTKLKVRRLKAILDKGPRSGFQSNQTFLMVKSFKLV